MQRMNNMTKKIFKLIFIALVAITLTFIMSGCGRDQQELEGKNVVTFDLNGGTLETNTASVSTQIKYAYDANTYLLDPAEDIPGCKLYRTGYTFTGWYTSAECKPDEKWDFEPLFNSPELTLFAGWKKAILHTYSVYCVVDGEEQLLGSYEVTAGDNFSDWRKYSKRKGYTAMGFYSDIEFTTPWDDSFKHPGGETDTNIKVYVDYIEGEWEFVSDYATLSSALTSGKNVYLTNDIDCGGARLINHSSLTSYNGIFEGNGFTVSNFKVEKYGTARFVIAIFRSLGATAEIRNVNFESVVYDFSGIPENAKNSKVAAVAVDAIEGAKITNVSVTGTLVTNYTGDISRLNEAVFDVEAVVAVEGFNAVIVVEQQGE